MSSHTLSCEDDQTHGARCTCDFPSMLASMQNGEPPDDANNHSRCAATDVEPDMAHLAAHLDVQGDEINRRIAQIEAALSAANARVHVSVPLDNEWVLEWGRPTEKGVPKSEWKLLVYKKDGGGGDSGRTALNSIGRVRRVQAIQHLPALITAITATMSSLIGEQDCAIATLNVVLARRPFKAAT